MPEGNVAWKLFKNAAALAVGRNLNALIRLITAGVIVRGFGAGTFGEYALIIALLNIADWLLDFGTTSVFVREMAAASGGRERLGRTLIALKLLQIPVAVTVLVTLLLVLQYPPRIVQAGLLSAVGLVWFAGVAAYRAVFRAMLVMEREVAAEFVSVLVMLSLVLLVSYRGGGLLWLFAAHVAARIVYFAACLVMGRRGQALTIVGVTWKDIRWAIGSTFAIGTIGFVVVLYNAADVLMLSRFSGLTDVAFYSGAQRFALPLLMALGAVGPSFYPVLASLRAGSPERFRRTCQQAVDATLVMGGLAACGLLAGAEFLMGLLGPELIGAADALRLLALMCVIKAVPLVIGPVLFIVKAQRYALVYIALALVLKITMLTLVAPKYGFIGVAFVSLAVETCFLVPTSLFFVKRFTGFAVRWSVGLRVLAAAVLTLGTISALLPIGTLPAAVAAAALYTVLAFIFRVVRMSELRTMLDRGRT